MWHDRSMSATPSAGELYLAAHRSFVDFARTLSADDWSVPVPCTPGWTVRDVLSHVAGIPDDSLAGRLRGVPDESSTAAQVERNREFSVDELFERWAAQVPGFTEVLETASETRPAIDCHSHEHDIRHALRRPGSRDSLIVEMVGVGMAQVRSTPFAVVVELDDGRVVSSGEPDAPDRVTLRRATTFELFRSRLGRRSEAQVRAYDWVGADPAIDAVMAAWFHFGPSEIALEE
jgi:uncharacterized protein (TIGR03083 family)